MARGELQMATPQSADADFDDELVEHALLWRRAMSDGALSPDEAAQLRDHFFQELTPVASDLSTSFRGIKSIVLCKNGIHGQRVKRFCNEAWARRGESNVIDLFPRVPQDAA